MNVTVSSLRFAVVLGVLLSFTHVTYAAYCIPNFAVGPGTTDYINGVELEEISNFSGAGTEYNDFTALSATVLPGSTYTLTLHNNPSYTEYYAAWIDWNQDEVFTSDERLNPADLILGPAAVGNISFTTPFTALPGETRMRVMCVYFPPGLIDPCALGGIYNYGETEDYTIDVATDISFDLGVSAIAELDNTCGLGVTPVSVTITNYGTAPSGSFQVAYRVTDPVLGLLPAVTQSYTGPVIPAGGSTNFTFTTLANYTTDGDYTVSAYTIYGVDAVPSDDTSYYSFVSLPLITTYPYTQGFETLSGFWQPGGILSSWERGDPDGAEIFGPPPPTPASDFSWTTDLDGNYNLNEQSYVISPCFDFSSMILPRIDFDLNYDIQLFDDGAKLQYTIDGGDTWLDVGGIGTGDNWYNHDECYAVWPAFYAGNYNGWSGNSGGWIHATHDLAMLAGEPSVRFRFTFSSSPFWNFNDGFAFDNVRIRDGFANDIGVIDIVDPVSAPYLGAAETITVEVKNFGTAPQTGFLVYVQFEGGAPISEVFAGTLLSGATGMHTFTPTFDLSADGTYVISAYTDLPGDGDGANDGLNEEVTNLSPVTGSGAWYIYSNVTGYEPYYSVSNTAHMNSVFGVGGWTTGYYETVDEDLLFSTDNCFIYLDGSDDHASTLEEFLSGNMELIENWVASGGHLFINASPTIDDGMSLGFGDVTLQYPWISESASAFDPLHPVFSGPYTPTFPVMTGSPYSNAEITGSGLTPILVDTYNPDKMVAAEKLWGAGTVVFSGMLVSEYHSPTIEATNFRKNLISYLATCATASIDAGVIAVVNPNDGCGLTDIEQITVRVHNFGFNTISDIPVHARVDGGAVVSETITSSIEPGASIDYTFTAGFDLSDIDTYTIEAWTSLGLDPIAGNDSASRIVEHIPFVEDFPYEQDWESGDAEGWRTYGAASSWALGMPAGPVINTAPTETPSSDYSWATNLTDFYNEGEISYLESPCFDLSALVAPILEFDLWWETEELWDGMQLLYTIDGGTTWNVLGDAGTGDNWYSGIATSLGDNYGWVGSSGGWVTAHHDIAFLGGSPSVRFRFYFAADGIIQFDGIGLDNFFLRNNANNDIGVTTLNSPESGTDLSASEVVTVTVENFGALAQTGFPVSYSVDGATPVTEIFTGTLLPGTTALFTFSTTANLSAIGMYDICAWTGLAGDADITNDSIPGCASVVHFELIYGNNIYYIYSEDVGTEPGTENAVSGAMDAIFGADYWSLDYYEEIDPFAVFSENSCFIYLEASEMHWSEFESFMSEYRALVEGWVSAGGHLIISANAMEGEGGEIGFDGVSIVYPAYTNETVAEDISHPVFTGPFTPITDVYTATYVSNAYIDGAIDPIMLNADCADCYLIGEKDWGLGTLLISTMGAPEYYIPTEEAGNLLLNSIDYVKTCVPVDAGVSAITAPESGCGLTATEAITIEITNFSMATLSNIPVYYNVDGLGEVNEIYPGPLAPGATDTYTFTATADLSTPGTYTINAWTALESDFDPANDATATEVNSLEVPVVDLGADITACDALTLDAGNPGSTYAWSTGETTQTITVTTSGEYSVTVQNPSSACTATDAINVTMEYSPDADFTYAITDFTVDFTNASTAGTEYAWDFGDGNSSTSEDPSHTYTANGNYTVTLTVTNDCGTDVVTYIIEVFVGIETQTWAQDLIVYPNPTADIAHIAFSDTEPIEVHGVIMNAVGEVIWEMYAPANTRHAFAVDLSDLSAGMYHLRLDSEKGSLSKQIILTK